MHGVTDEEGPGGGLVSRVRVIEEQPLAQRAAAYAALHDELARRLESAPADGADAADGRDEPA